MDKDERQRQSLVDVLRDRQSHAYVEVDARESGSPSFGRVFSTVWKTFMAILLIIVILGFGCYLLALAA